MALLDIFKGKKNKQNKAPKQSRKVAELAVEKKAEKKAEAAEIKTEIKTAKPREAKIGEAYRILKNPHISEKATDLNKNNQYVFRVYPRSNKTEIKRAVEDIYGVDVVSVRIINIPKKTRRVGRTTGVKSGYKKAIVKIAPGQKIEVLPR